MLTISFQIFNKMFNWIFTTKKTVMYNRHTIKKKLVWVYSVYERKTLFSTNKFLAEPWLLFGLGEFVCSMYCSVYNQTKYCSIIVFSVHHYLKAPSTGFERQCSRDFTFVYSGRFHIEGNSTRVGTEQLPIVLSRMPMYPKARTFSKVSL